MRHDFILKGLACANCGSKIEADVKNIENVEDASLNFAVSTLSVFTSDCYKGDLHNEIDKIVKIYEPKVNTIKKEDGIQHEHSHPPGSSKSLVLRISLSLAVFAAALIFDFAHPLNLILFSAAYIISGYDVIISSVLNLFKGRVLDENFLMAIASIGAFAIGEYPEGVAVMIFYQVGEYFQHKAVHKSRKSISQLMDIRPDYANLINGSDVEKIAPENIAIDDMILVKPGEKIPLDGIVCEGESLIDTVALTGESVPRTAKYGDEVLSGSINLNGVLTVKVLRKFSQSTASKILDLVENAASKKTPTENFITTFAKYYTPAVVAIAVVLAFVPVLFGSGDLNDWVYRALLFLVVSCPCALVISVPLGFFGGIGGASKNGILIKGGNYLEAMSKADTVVFDKTGTLTQGVFTVNKIIPSNNFSQEDVLKFAACAEFFSSHPIAMSIKESFGEEIDGSGISGYNEISGHGICVNAFGNEVLAGNDKLMIKYNISYDECCAHGTKVYVAVDGVFSGCIVISDKIKDDSRQAILKLKSLGLRKIIMLTGDNRENAEAVSQLLGIDDFFANLLPDQKVYMLERLLKDIPKGKKLIFAGDGINDAPVLARSNIGIAMGGVGSDAAIEAADVVIMNDSPLKVADSINIAKFTKKIVTQNIVFALFSKLVVLVLGALGLASMWAAVFVDVGVSLIAVLNSMRALQVK
ncbi:MAG: cadmium-translocating P-type ATPase [Oscillospiraceae bacterium]|nr:cadmium-translocating P-type ATPase [Oscillospiraceae bacterium]